MLLRQHPRARERRFKNKAVAHVLKEMYPNNLGSIDTMLLADIVQETHTLDRHWRKILAENESLRGKDYGQKKKLVQQAQIDLGYTPGYLGDVDKLKNL